METYFVNEKREIGSSHDPQAMAIKKVLQLQAVGHVHKKYLPINLFDIHVRVYKSIKIWMVKIWRIFGRSSISPNFSVTKVSLHMVFQIHNKVIALQPYKCCM